MLNSFVRLVNLYWRFLVSPEKYALHIGIKIGKNCFIATREWSSEPYLISIGYNCQIIKNVYIHTHGGGQAVRNICPEFDTYGKVTINVIKFYENLLLGKNNNLHSEDLIVKELF